MRLVESVRTSAETGRRSRIPAIHDRVVETIEVRAGHPELVEFVVSLIERDYELVDDHWPPRARLRLGEFSGGNHPDGDAWVRWTEKRPLLDRELIEILPEVYSGRWASGSDETVHAYDPIEDLTACGRRGDHTLGHEVRRGYTVQCRSCRKRLGDDVTRLV